MSIQRIFVALRMMTSEFTRRRLAQIMLIVVPLLMVLSVYYALPDDNMPLDVVENTITFETLASQRDIITTFVMLFTISFLAAFFGFYLMLSAKSVDYRLVLCGYQPIEVVTARSLLMVLICLVLTFYVTVILLPFFTPATLLSFFYGLFLCALVYGFYGELVGTLIGRELEGSYVVVLLPFLDTGYLQMPGFSAVLEEDWLKFFPGYFPARITIDSAFTSVGDVQHEFLGALVYALNLWLLASGVFWLSTGSLAGSLRSTAKRPHLKWVLTLIAVVLLGATGYVATPYIDQPGIVEAEGELVAPGAEIVSVTAGSLRDLLVQPGDYVNAGQQLGRLKDAQTGSTHHIRAPISGTVTNVDVMPGESVTAGQIVAEVHDLNQLEVQLDVEEVFVGQLVAGQEVMLTVSGLQESVPGHIVTIGLSPVAEERVTSPGETEKTIKKYPVAVAMDMQPTNVRLGMRVRGSILVVEESR